MWINKLQPRVRSVGFVHCLALTALLWIPTSEVGATEVKDPLPPAGTSLGSPSEATGGPDAYGYTFEDSAEISCPYAFTDISATGTSLGGGDEASFVTSLAESFTFYGVTFTESAVSTNGYISTDITDSGGDLTNDCPLPVSPSTGGGARIYPLHDDFVTGDIQTQYFTQCPRPSDRCTLEEACTVFQWSAVTHFGDDTEWSHQVILYHASGDIVAQIGAGNPEVGSGSTTGLQNDGATDGLTYACNVGQSVPDDTGVCFRNPDALPEGTCLPARIDVLEVPTASAYGLLALMALLSAAALVLLRRRGN